MTSTLAFYNSLLPGIASAGGDRPRLDGGLRPRLPRGRAAPGAEPVHDQQPRHLRPRRRGGGHAGRLPDRRRLVGGLLHPPLPEGARAAARRVVPGEAGASTLQAAFGRLGETFRDLRTRYKDAGLLLLAFLLYNDAVNTIIRLATTFADEIGIPAPYALAAILMVQFVGVPFAFLFGALADRIGAKRAIFVGLFIYVLHHARGLRPAHAPGSSSFSPSWWPSPWAGSRPSRARSSRRSSPSTRPGRCSASSGSSTASGGPWAASCSASCSRATGSSRPAILALIVFFVAGGFVLSQVDVARGRASGARGRGRGLGGMKGSSSMRSYRCRLLVTGLAVLSFPGCSVKSRAVSSLGNALAQGTSSFASDDDPELVREAMPFGLKTCREPARDLAAKPGPALTPRRAAFASTPSRSSSRTPTSSRRATSRRATALRDRARRLYLRGRRLWVARPGGRFPGLRPGHPEGRGRGPPPPEEAAPAAPLLDGGVAGSGPSPCPSTTPTWPPTRTCRRP